MTERNEGVGPNGAFLLATALALGLGAAQPASAQGSTAFQEWVAARQATLGFKIANPASGPEARFAHGEITFSFDESVRGTVASSAIQSAVTEYCLVAGGSVVSTTKGWACGSNGSEWLLLESLKPIRSGVATGILRSMRGSGGTMDDLLSDRKASNFNAWLLEAPSERREHPGFRQAMTQRGRVSVPALQADAKKQQARIEAELPRKLLVGTRICKKQGAYDWLGFTEAYSSDTGKIQVRVAGTTNGFRPGGWQPEVIWEYPDQWRVCE